MKVCLNRKCPRRKFDPMPKPEDNFCHYCGTELVEIGKPTCKNCGTEPQLGDEFCRNCGRKVEK